MKRFKNILLVCDFDTKQQVAVEHAVSLSQQNEAKLTVFSVVKDVPADIGTSITAVTQQEFFKQIINDRQEQLNSLLADINKQGVEAETMVVTGTPFIEIVRQVLRNKHDLVITAAEDKKGIRAHLFGTTSMHLMRKCPCPVWVIKRAHSGSFRHIMAAIDPSAYDPKRDSLNPLILQLASSMARKESADLHIVHAWHLYGESYINRLGMKEEDILKAKTFEKKQHKDRVDNLLSKLDVIDLKPYLHLVEGYPDDLIPELVVSQGIDLLVMGTVCRTGIAGFLIGNTAEEVLNEVDCSVLTLKPEDFITPVTL